MPESPPAPRPVVAAFDVDGTLTTRDCVTPFLRRAGGMRLARALLGHPRALLGALARRDRDALKELACASLAGLDGDALDGLGERFADEVAETRLRPDTTARLRRHRELGHTVVLASASLDPYLVPLGRLLDVDGVVCTVLERGADGRLTGRLVGENCRGPEKERRLRAWLASAGLEGAEVWAYGDSAGDDEMLAGADHAVRVSRNELVAEPLG